MVKCADCGYLAQHIYQGSVPQGFIDIEETSRDTGELPSSRFSFSFLALGKPDLTPEKMSGDNFPTCFNRAFQIGQEVKARHSEMTEAGKDASFASAVKDVIHKDRVCKQFVKWERGFTPKEHWEMMDRERMTEREDKRIREDREWQTKQQIRLVLIAGIFTILGAIIGVLVTILR